MTDSTAEATTTESEPAQVPESAEVDGAQPGKTETEKADGTDWRAEAKKWEARAKENRIAATKLAEIELANKTDLEKAVAAARSEGISEVTERVNTRLVRSEARAIAAGANFHNPSDAVGLVDLSGVKVNDDGDVDADAIKALITDLAKERPYLIKTDEPKQQKPKPDHSQGARTGGTSTTAQQFAAALTPILSP